MTRAWRPRSRPSAHWTCSSTTPVSAAGASVPAKRPLITCARSMRRTCSDRSASSHAFIPLLEKSRRPWSSTSQAASALSALLRTPTGHGARPTPRLRLLQSGAQHADDPVVGTVSSVSTSSFTVSTSAGQKVTVKQASSTTYRKGTSSASASAIATGTPVHVLGTTNATTITASQVIVHPASGGSPTFTPSTVVPFKRGADHVKAGRPDPGELQSGLRDDRQRHDRESGDRSGTGRLSRRRRRPCGQAEQRRVRGPQHRRQLAPPHLRQQELQGRRRQLAPSPRDAAHGLGSSTRRPQHSRTTVSRT